LLLAFYEATQIAVVPPMSQIVSRNLTAGLDPGAAMGGPLP